MGVALQPSDQVGLFRGNSDHIPRKIFPPPDHRGSANSYVTRHRFQRTKSCFKTAAAFFLYIHTLKRDSLSRTAVHTCRRCTNLLDILDTAPQTPKMWIHRQVSRDELKSKFSLQLDSGPRFRTSVNIDAQQSIFDNNPDHLEKTTPTAFRHHDSTDTHLSRREDKAALDLLINPNALPVWGRR